MCVFPKTIMCVRPCFAALHGLPPEVLKDILKVRGDLSHRGSAWVDRESKLIVMYKKGLSMHPSKTFLHLHVLKCIKNA